jgi:adenosine kinase
VPTRTGTLDIPGHVVVTGSLAFDNIMDFQGYFKDHIKPDKAHVISISFLVDKLTRQRGGCAANIAYTMALLGEHPRIVAAAGGDFEEYRRYLADLGIDVGGIVVFPEEMTASCFITTDQADCQITAFHVGAMKRAREISLAATAGDGVGFAVVAPDDPEAMLRHCAEARSARLPFLFDPSFQVTNMDGRFLAEASAGAWALAMNDYEFSVFRDKTGKSTEDLLAEHELIVVTYGSEGSKILLRDGGVIDVPGAAAGEVLDPTGAGDAFRGGFVAGLKKGYDLPVCGRMGSVAAVYAIESYGTQSHRYTTEEFYARYRENFGASPLD